MTSLSTPVPSRTGYFSVIGKSACLYLIGCDDFAEPVAVGDELLSSPSVFTVPPLSAGSSSFSISPTISKHQELINKASKQAAESPDIWKCIEIRPLKLAFRFYNSPDKGPIRVDHLPEHKGETLEYFFVRRVVKSTFEDQLYLTVKTDPLFQESKVQVTEHPIKLYTLYPEGIFNDPE